MIRRLLRTVRSRGLIRPADRVLIALSGGVDSVVLLHLLRSCARRLHIELKAAHFDHAMRPESAADAEWVAGLCRAWEVPLVCERADRPLLSEADARSERYRFLMRALHDSGSTRIATAHHADDQIETVLFRMLRGSGLRGLAGIPVRRGRLIRPLLRFSKADLLDYAHQNHIAFREDPTNAQLDYARNRIRRTVIPALETVVPNAGSAVLAFARYAARTEAALHAAVSRLEAELVRGSAPQFVELARPELLKYDAELRALVLRRVLRRFGIVPGRGQTRELLAFCERANSGTTLLLAHDVRLERAFDRIRIERARAPSAEDAVAMLTGPAGHARIAVGGRNYDIEWVVDDVRRQSAAHFDASLAESGAVLRGWRAGDRIRLSYGTKKLKKLFAERRIPGSVRGTYPVLTDVDGRVLWLVGLARSIDAQPAESGPAFNVTVRNAEFG